MYLRVITNSKWKEKLIRDENLLPADCLSDLRTQGNSLSVWKVDNPNDNEEIEKLCMVQALCRNKLQKVFYVLICEDTIEDENIIITNNIGVCKCVKNPQLLQKHIDLDQLDSKQLEKIAFTIRSQVKAEKNYGFFTEKQIKNCIDKYIQNNEIDKDLIEPDFM